MGVAAAIADLEPSATVTVTGSSTNIAVNGASGNVTIGADSSATVNTGTTVGTSIAGSALNPVDAAIAESVVNSSAVAQVGGGSTVKCRQRRGHAEHHVDQHDRCDDGGRRLGRRRAARRAP